jgi:hypothetical protein
MKITLLLVMATMLCACAQPGKFVQKNTPNNCDGKGKVDLFVKYGDSKIDVTAKIEVAQSGEINVMLKPDKGFENTEIAFEGKNVEDAWLNKKDMKHSDGKKQVFICVKPDQAPGEYSYNVVVDGVGKIDPRAIVIQDEN